MSFSAYVPCNCYKEGKTKPTPEVHYITVDEEGIQNGIPDELWDNNVELTRQLLSEFDSWKATACEHKNLRQEDFWLSNNSGMYDFKRALIKYGGATQFPILIRYLPTSNDGCLPNEYAKDALDELEKFYNNNHYELINELRDLETNEEIQSVNSGAYRVFSFMQKAYFGIGDNGFYILKSNGKAEYEEKNILFVSKQFMQHKLSNNLYKFTCLKSNIYFYCSESFGSYCPNQKSTREFKFEQISVKVSDQYNYIIGALKKLALASIETGNPIIWT